jgi:hypothetical protein
MGTYDDAGNEIHADSEIGYDGTTAPVHIEDIDDTNGPAVILGELRQDGHVISADGRGVLVVKSAGGGTGTAHAPL